jgi:hypothetical protein
MFMRPPKTDLVVVTPGRKPKYGSTLAPGDTFTQEFPPPNDSGLPTHFSVSIGSDLYVENRKRKELFLYLFVGTNYQANLLL